MEKEISNWMALKVSMPLTLHGLRIQDKIVRTEEDSRANGEPVEDDGLPHRKLRETRQAWGTLGLLWNLSSALQGAVVPLLAQIDCGRGY